MSYLSDLQSQLSRLEGERDDCKSRLRIQKNRKEELENLKQDITRTGNNGYGPVNTFLSKAANALQEAISLENIFSVRSTEMQEYKEKETSSDSLLGEALFNLQQELTSVSAKIDELENNIRYLDQRISSTKSAIADELRRMAEEKLKGIF